MMKIGFIAHEENGDMKNKKYITTMKIIGIMAILGMTGCSSATKQETYNMLQDSTEIELEYAELDTVDNKEISSLDWIELGKLTTYSDLRASWDKIVGVTGTTGNKTGMFYDGWEGTTQDSYLAAVIGMNEFVDFVSNEDNYNKLVDAVRENFTDSDDLTDDQLFDIGLNAYFNLLPMKDEAESYANDYITRAQFLALITRATNPVSIKDTDDYKENLEKIDSAVGDSVYNEAVAFSLDYGYLTTEDNSLNEQSYDSAISRGEAVYTIMSMLYGENELQSVDIDSASNIFSDAKNAGDIQTEQNFKNRAQAISYAIQNPDKGCPEDIYRALVKANELGVIGSDTAWDEAITLSEAIDLYYNTAVCKLVTNTTESNDTENTDITTSAPTSESWSEYAETYDYIVEHTNSAIAHMMNPDVYGTETAGKATEDFQFGDCKPDATQYIKRLKLTTTKGFRIQALWYTETNTVQYLYVGEVSPYGGWYSDMDSMIFIQDNGKSQNLLDYTHQEKIELLGEPSMTPDEVIAYIQANGISL